MGRFKLLSEGFVVSCYFVHNFGISNVEMGHFERLICDDIRLAKSSPIGRSVILMGDFNLEPVGAQRFSIPSPSSTLSADLERRNHSQTAPRFERWQRIFDDLTEISSGAPTHYYPLNPT